MFSDIDECSLNPTLCENGQCLNYGGSYKCECDMGFAPEDNERACVGMFLFVFCIFIFFNYWIVIFNYYERESFYVSSNIEKKNYHS